MVSTDTGTWLALALVYGQYSHRYMVGTDTDTLTVLAQVQRWYWSFIAPNPLYIKCKMFQEVQKNVLLCFVDAIFITVFLIDDIDGMIEIKFIENQLNTF